jgi:hypothetical protein
LSSRQAVKLKTNRIGNNNLCIYKGGFVIVKKRLQQVIKKDGSWRRKLEVIKRTVKKIPGNLGCEGNNS